MTTLKMRLTIDIEFDLSDAEPGDAEQIKRNLDFIPTHISGEGLFSRDTDAYVNTIEHKVEVVQ
jgi:hypothetical protein